MAITGYGQDKEIRAIYKEQATGQGVTKIALPGWVARMGANIATDKEDKADPDNALMREFLRPLKQLRVMIVENPSKHLSERVRNLGKHINPKSYKEMITVRTEDAFVRVWMCDKLKKKKGIRFIKRLVLSVGQDDELILVSIKGRWDLRLILDNLGMLKKMTPMLNGSLL